MKYFEISISTNHACSDFVAATLWGLGCEGVATYDKQDYLDLLQDRKEGSDAELMAQDGNVVLVKGFFLEDIVLAQVEEEVRGLRRYNVSCGSLETTGAWLDDADYADEWKKYYKTIIIGAVAIVPCWLTAEEALVNVLLDPGAAFGTGAHDTTYMCVDAMQQLDLVDKTVIDLGCGSGILGLTALKLGAKRAILIDIDKIAVEVSRANANMNDLVSQVETVCGDIAETKLHADILFANITADVLCLLSTNLMCHMNKGGKLLISGIIDREYEHVLSTYEGNSYRVLEHIQRGDWHSLLLERD